jgi:hypothetical protein
MNISAPFVRDLCRVEKRLKYVSLINKFNYWIYMCRNFMIFDAAHQ